MIRSIGCRIVPLSDHVFGAVVVLLIVAPLVSCAAPACRLGLKPLPVYRTIKSILLLLFTGALLPLLLLELLGLPLTLRFGCPLLSLLLLAHHLLKLALALRFGTLLLLLQHLLDLALALGQLLLLLGDFGLKASLLGRSLLLAVLALLVALLLLLLLGGPIRVSIFFAGVRGGY